MAAADAGYSSFDEMQEDARLKRAEQLLRERRESEARRHAIEVKLRQAMSVEQGEKRRRQQFKDRIKNVLAILAFIAAILLLWQCGAFGAPFAEGQRAAKFRSLNPLVEYFQDDSVLYYDANDIPRAYQLNASDAPTVFFDHRQNVAANPDGQPSNANAEAPWNRTGGMDYVPENAAYDVRFVRLPKDSQGRTKPIVWWVDSMPDGYFSGLYETYRWRFPVGTAVGEIVVLKCPDGMDRPCEVRIRHRQTSEWAVEIFRPFANPAELAGAIQALRPQWRSENRVAAAVTHLTNPVEVDQVSYTDRHVNPVVNLEYSRYRLPEMPADLVSELLDRIEFQEVTGATWYGENCFAPTADGYSIVPPKYAAHAIGADNESCKKCHETVGRGARTFTAGREWYGRVRGADNIFSFHPVRTDSFGGRPSFYQIPGVIEPANGRQGQADYPKLEY